MKVRERECLDEVKKDGKEKRQRKCVNSNEEMPHGMGCPFLQPAVRLRQYRIILSADTASEVRQLLSQKRG